MAVQVGECLTRKSAARKQNGKWWGPMRVPQRGGPSFPHEPHGQ